MSRSDELRVLAEKVQALTGPCRKTDARITYACSPLMRELGSVEDYLATDACKKVRAYTSSLDAAMTLVPDGWCFEVTLWQDKQASASVSQYNPGEQDYEAKGATPALALAAAALLARAALAE